MVAKRGKSKKKDPGERRDITSQRDKERPIEKTNEKTTPGPAWTCLDPCFYSSSPNRTRWTHCSVADAPSHFEQFFQNNVKPVVYVGYVP
eukprot:scaffold71437_cov32-Attheya_sp.AAC.2